MRKDLDAREQHVIIKLKGSLILKGYTEIIHIVDQDHDYHINTFETAAEKRNKVHEYIAAFIDQESLQQAISIIN